MERVVDYVKSHRMHGHDAVALESTIIAHGLPRPDNLRVAREIEGVVRSNGAVPATVVLCIFRRYFVLSNVVAR